MRFGVAIDSKLNHMHVTCPIFGLWLKLNVPKCDPYFGAQDVWSRTNSHDTSDNMQCMVQPAKL